VTATVLSQPQTEDTKCVFFLQFSHFFSLSFCRIQTEISFITLVLRVFSYQRFVKSDQNLGQTRRLGIRTPHTARCCCTCMHRNFPEIDDHGWVVEF
jgi:hypothetical protein